MFLFVCTSLLPLAAVNEMARSCSTLPTSPGGLREPGPFQTSKPLLNLDAPSSPLSIIEKEQHQQSDHLNNKNTLKVSSEFCLLKYPLANQLCLRFNKSHETNRETWPGKGWGRTGPPRRRHPHRGPAEHGKGRDQGSERPASHLGLGQTEGGARNPVRRRRPPAASSSGRGPRGLRRARGRAGP